VRGGVAVVKACGGVAASWRGVNLSPLRGLSFKYVAMIPGAYVYDLRT